MSLLLLKVPYLLKQGLHWPGKSGEGQGKSKKGNFAGGQEKFYVSFVFFSSCIMIVTFSSEL